VPQNFIALEHHFNKVPTWGDFIDGISKPIIQNGYIPVPVQNVAWRPCSSRCDGPGPEWPPRGFIEDDTGDT